MRVASMADAAKDYPFYEVVGAVKVLASQGHLCYQKFTCSGCGNRLTIEEPNRFYVQGTCDRCSAITDIVKSGCNYLVVMKTKE